MRRETDRVDVRTVADHERPQRMLVQQRGAAADRDSLQAGEVQAHEVLAG